MSKIKGTCRAAFVLFLSVAIVLSVVQLEAQRRPGPFRRAKPKPKIGETATISVKIQVKDQAARIALQRKIEDWVLAEEAAGRKTEVHHKAPVKYPAVREKWYVLLDIKLGVRTPQEIDKGFDKLRSWSKGHISAWFVISWTVKRE